MKNIKLSSQWILILLLAGFKLLLHFATNTNYELHRDAYLYLAMADHLDFGFVSVPPFIAVAGKVIQTTLGDSVFAIRLLPALTGAVSVVVIGLLVRELGGGLWAIAIASVAFVLSPAYLRSNLLFQPVTFNQFFWLLSGLLVVKLLKTQNPKFWIPLGVIWGLAFLNKYSIVFFALACLLALLLTSNRRLIFTRPFVIGAFLGLLLIFPNLIWQFNHNWPVVMHMRELQQTQLVNVQIIDFLLMQVLMNLHAVIVWLVGLVFLLFAKAGKTYRALGLTFLGVFFLLLVLRGKPYYTLGLYPILFASGGVAIEHYFSYRLRFVRPFCIAMMVVVMLPILPYSLPVLAPDKMAAYAQQSKRYGLEGALRWEDGRIHPLPQDYADMTGWKQLADFVIQTYQNLPENEKNHCAIYAENYGQAGAIRYYGKKYGLPNPVCFNGSFLLWAPDSAKLSTLIYVNEELGTDIQSLFANVKLAGRVSDPYFRENGLQVYLFRQPRPEFENFYSIKVRALKTQFNR